MLSVSAIEVDDIWCVEPDLDLLAGARAMATVLDRHPDVRAGSARHTLAVGALFEAQGREMICERLADHTVGSTIVDVGYAFVPRATT